MERLAAESSRKGPVRGVCLVIGIINGRLFVTYVGRSRDQLARLLQHLVDIAHDDGTHLFYQHASWCDEILFFPLFEQEGDGDEVKACVRAIIEGFWTMLLGSFCRSDAFNQHRCNYGLFDIGDDVVGGNKTPCWEDVESVAVAYEESVHGQVLDAEYLAAARLVRLMHCFIEKAAESGDAVAEAKQRTKLWTAQVAFEPILPRLQTPQPPLPTQARSHAPRPRVLLGVESPKRLVEEMDELTDGDWLL